MDLTSEEAYLLDVTHAIELTLYSLVMLGILHNFFRFIIKDGRWKETGITPFYVFAFLTVGLRIGMIVGYNVSYSLSYRTENGYSIKCIKPEDVDCSIKKSTDGYMYGNICTVTLK